LLAIRARGREELRRALEGRHFRSEAVVEALDRLEREGWIDDLGAARSAVRQRGERYGTRRLARELAARGFSRETIEEALSERASDAEENALARALERAWKSHAGKPAPARRRAVQDALLRRGFSGEKISAMIERLKRDEVPRGPRALS
jgi:SOS response regulatory protein OraA/RecX